MPTSRKITSPTTDLPFHGFFRVREEISLHFQESRRTHGKARGGRIASYFTDEQRSQAGWIGASKCEVIFERALSLEKKRPFMIVSKSLLRTNFTGRMRTLPVEAKNG